MRADSLIGFSNLLFDSGTQRSEKYGMRAWHRFLQDLELAKTYPAAYQLAAFMGGVPRNPILDRLLPWLLFVRLVSLLDEALGEHISSQKLPFQGKPDLYHRLEYLKDRNLITNAAQLHALRERRRSLAHDSLPNAVVDPTGLSWSDLSDAVDQVEAALQTLGLVGPRPCYAFFCERSSARPSADPRVAFGFDYSAGLKREGKVVVEFQWTASVFREGEG